MRYKYRTYTLYTLAELSPRARSQAYDDWLRRPPEYVFAADNNKTLEAFCDLFGVQCRDWHYDASRHGFRFDTDYSDQELNLSGVRLLSLLCNRFSRHLFPPKIYWSRDARKKRHSRIFTDTRCPLTGFWVDDEILSPIYEFLKRPDRRTFFTLLHECLDSFFEACSQDCDYCTSEEYFEQESDANKYEYLENGKLFS